MSRSPLVRCQQVEPRQDDGLDVVRNLDLVDPFASPPPLALPDQPAVIDQVADDLLGEERIPTGAFEDQPTHTVGQRVDTGKERDQARALCAAQWVERQRAEAPTPSAPVRARVEQLGARRAEEEEPAVEPLGELVEDVEHRRVGPVQVLHHGDDWGAHCHRDEQRPPRIHQLAVELPRVERCEGVARRPQPQRRGQGRRAARRFAGQLRLDADLDERCDLRGGFVGRVRLEHARFGLQHLAQRPQGDPVPGGEAAPDEHLRLALERREELAHKPALADAGVADHRYERRTALEADAVEGRSQERELVGAADERSCDGRCPEPLSRIAITLHEPGHKRLGVSVQRERLADRAELEVRANGARSPIGDDDRSRLRDLLEARGDVDGAARDVDIASCHARSEHVARAQADTDCQRLRRVKGFVEAAKALEHAPRCAHGSDGVVLVHRRDTEDGHHRPADELLDRAAFGLDLPRHRREVVADQGAEILRVPLLRPCGRADDVGEEDGHELQHLLRLPERRGRRHLTRPGRRGREIEARVVAQDLKLELL